MADVDSRSLSLCISEREALVFPLVADGVGQEEVYVKQSKCTSARAMLAEVAT
jgi:hypothetical protein